MDSNNKPKIITDEFVGGFAILGGIIGTILFVYLVFGEWYSDFDLEPSGLITGILILIVFLLPFAISVFMGGGGGFILGGIRIRDYVYCEFLG